MQFKSILKASGKKYGFVFTLSGCGGAPSTIFHLSAGPNAKRDVDLVAQRLRAAAEDYGEHYGKSKR